MREECEGGPRDGKGATEHDRNEEGEAKEEGATCTCMLMHAHARACTATTKK